MLTAKQEAFCLKIIEGLSQTEAYEAAYGPSDAKPASIKKMAGKVASRSAVQARIGFLRGAVAETVVKKALYTLEDALAEADSHIELARDEGQASAAVAATTLKAKLVGLLVEKKEISHKGPLDTQDMAELEAIRDEANRRLAAAKAADDLTGTTTVLAVAPRPQRKTIA